MASGELDCWPRLPEGGSRGSGFVRRQMGTHCQSPSTPRRAQSNASRRTRILARQLEPITSKNLQRRPLQGARAAPVPGTLSVEADQSAERWPGTLCPHSMAVGPPGPRPMGSLGLTSSLTPRGARKCCSPRGASQAAFGVQTDGARVPVWPPTVRACGHLTPQASAPSSSTES